YDRKGGQTDVLDAALRAGIVSVCVDGVVALLDEVRGLGTNTKHTIEAVVDRVVTGDAARSRLTDSVETALKTGQGRVRAAFGDGEERAYSDQRVCAKCGTAFPELSPQLFSWNNPQGACPDCGGLGKSLVASEELVVADEDLTLEEGALLPWASRLKKDARGMNADFGRGVIAKLGIRGDVPWKKIPEAKREKLLHGAGDVEFEIKLAGKRWESTFKTKFEGILNRIEKRWRESQSESVRKSYAKYMREEPCKACGGKRLRVEALSVRVGGKS